MVERLAPRRSQKLLLWQQLLDPPKWVRVSGAEKFIFNVPFRGRRFRL